MLRRADSRARDVLIGAVVVFFVMTPAIFTHKAFGFDSTNHAWLIWVQGLAIKHTGHPTLFFSAESQGIFEPYYGFYGGTLYALAGYISVVFGAQAAYTGTCALFVAMAYRGVWLLARLAGTGRLTAHLPAFVFVTSAYFLTDQYARSAWPELAALSALPFALAYGLRLLREPWTAGPVAGFAFGAVIVTGSHNISLLFSTIIVFVLGVAAYVVAGAGRPPVRRVLRLVAFLLLCIGVNLWFLGLDLRHAGDTIISHVDIPWKSSKDFDWLSNTLSLWRITPSTSGTVGLTVATPILALFGALWLRSIAGPATTPSERSRRRVMFVILAGVVILIAMVRMPGGGWDFLGKPFTLIQYPYRLAGWITLGTALVFAFAIGLLGSQPRAPRRRLRLATAFLVLFTVGQATAQLYPGFENKVFNRDRSEAFDNGPSKVPASWYDPGSYRDTSLPLIAPDQTRKIAFELPKPGVTQLHEVVMAPEGAGPIVTNIAGGPYVVRFEGTGFHVSGRDSNGYIIIERAEGGRGPLDITVRADGGRPQTVATAISIASLVLILLYVALLMVRGRQVRRRAPAADGVTPGVAA